MLLDSINNPNDIKNIPEEDMPLLAEEIRKFLIEKISENGGHLASNLGVVELTMALHLAFNLPDDKIVWDVGHQSYTHKILTGRKMGFESLRKYGGMSGFPKRSESNCDAFDTGHSSTSISAGLGLALAREIKGEKYSVISVIGDGALTGGMAFEALNNASRIRSNFIIVLNDNKMSISENVGGISKHLGNIRTAKPYQEIKTGIANSLEKIPRYGEQITDSIRGIKSSIKQLVVPGMFFENMGILYIGPVDGHDISGMVKVFKDASRYQGPVLIHVITKKGKGYAPAEKHPARYHGAEPFNIATGKPKHPHSDITYTDVFSKVIKKIGENNENVCAITAAMQDGTGLKPFHYAYPNRFFDVGIAEEHAVTFSAGLAAAGLKPFFAVYSSFLQRAYDQILHDVCLQNLPVVFCIDRAGIVGSDGETHQGIFDISYLSAIPNITLMAPKNMWELADMLKFAADFDSPIAIRYPRGVAYNKLKDKREKIEFGKSELIHMGNKVCLFAYGSMVKTAVEVQELLKDEGLNVTIINARFAKPLDEDTLIDIANSHELIVTMEENVIKGGLGESVIDFFNEKGIDVPVQIVAIPDDYVEHGNVDILRHEVGIDADSIVRLIKKRLVK
ncbi:MAG: 1-deoxy-D-xylulose-5-phosphate synthase [Lachnospiraceae bacterium]|nr:1-deoxy-D-xylulose-5-phosphate synthase [Lachnospiraceae bacterium]